MLPHSLNIIRDYLDNYQPPIGSFDPSAEWEHRYVMWIALRGNAGKSWPGGALNIRRRLGESGRIKLEVDQVTSLRGPGGTGHTRATLTCASDRLSTPQTWEIESEIVNNQGQSVDYTRVKVNGEVASGKIVCRGAAERRMKAPKSFASNWSLFDAVQRLPLDAKPISFDLLEDLELLKPNHRLEYRQSVELKLGERTARLHGFEQIGEGILPYMYWLDEQHRLLFAVGGLRTFLLEPNAEDAL